MHSRRIGVALVVLLFLAGPAGAQFVERLIDGDTIVVASVGPVRLIGVDTPETADPRGPVEAFGQEAAAFVREPAEGKVVRLTYDQDRLDRYNGTPGHAYLSRGEGVARWHRRHKNPCAITW